MSNQHKQRQVSKFSGPQQKVCAVHQLVWLSNCMMLTCMFLPFFSVLFSARAGMLVVTWS